MAIRVKHGKPSTQIRAAKKAGDIRQAGALAAAALNRATQLQVKEMELQHRAEIHAQDMAMELEERARSRLWEMEKMELNSKADFAREMRKRESALDEYEASVKYIQDSDFFEDSMKERLIFKAKMKLLNQGVSDKVVFPELYRSPEKGPSPTQRMAAMKALRQDVYQEPTGWRKYAPTWLGGKEALSEQELAEKSYLQSIAGGDYPIPTGTVTDELFETKPSTVTEFESVVARLKREDMDAAREYYNKWAGQF